MYGIKEHAGVEWPLDPSSSELKTSIEEYYNILKYEILTKLNDKNYLNMYSNETFMNQTISKDDYFNKLQENNQNVLTPNFNSSIILCFIFIKWLIF